MLALTHGDEKKQTQIQQTKINRKIHLTRYRVCTLLFCCKAAAIAFAPSSPIRLKSFTHGDEKKQTQIQHTKINRKIQLTRFSVRTLLFCCRAAATAFAPSLPISL
jgi:hypothetical protein